MSAAPCPPTPPRRRRPSGCLALSRPSAFSARRMARQWPLRRQQWKLRCPHQNQPADRPRTHPDSGPLVVGKSLSLGAVLRLAGTRRVPPLPLATLQSPQLVPLTHSPTPTLLLLSAPAFFACGEGSSLPSLGAWRTQPLGLGILLKPSRRPNLSVLSFILRQRGRGQPSAFLCLADGDTKTNSGDILAGPAVVPAPRRSLAVPRQKSGEPWRVLWQALLQMCKPQTSPDSIPHPVVNRG